MKVQKPGEQKFSFRIKHSGKWPPNLSSLAGLGFDSISSRHGAVILRKSHGTGLLGKTGNFTQIELRRDSALLLHRHPEGLRSGAALIAPALLLLRTLSLIPGTAVDMQTLSGFLLPLLESAESVAATPYQSLAKKYSDLQSDFAEMSSKSRRALSDSESCARRNLELEKTLSAMQERVRNLESVSNSALRELLSDWLSTHKGSFSAASFCRQTGIPPSRCEEGLELLQKEGAIVEIPQGFSVVKKSPLRAFQKNTKSSLPSLKDAGDSFASSVSKLLGQRPV